MQRQHEEAEDGTSNFQVDQIAYMLAQCVVFCQMPRWESYKFKFFSIILCTVANMRDDKDAIQPKPTGQQTEYATGKKVLSITRQQ